MFAEIGCLRYVRIRTNAEISAQLARRQRSCSRSALELMFTNKNRYRWRLSSDGKLEIFNLLFVLKFRLTSVTFSMESVERTYFKCIKSCYTVRSSLRWTGQETQDVQITKTCYNKMKSVQNASPLEKNILRERHVVNKSSFALQDAFFPPGDVYVRHSRALGPSALRSRWLSMGPSVLETSTNDYV